MSSDNLQMHQINSSGDSTLANSQNSNSTSSMMKSANIQFVSDSPITDPGQSSKAAVLDERAQVNDMNCVCQHDRVRHVYDPVLLRFYYPIFVCFAPSDSRAMWLATRQATLNNLLGNTQH